LSASSRVQMLVRKVDFLTAALMQNTDALQKMVCTATEPAHRACNRACTTTEPATEPCIATEPPTEPASADKREAGRERGRETKILIPQVVLEQGKSQYTIQLHEAAHCVRSEMAGSLKNRKASSLKSARKPFTIAEIPAPPSNPQDFLGNLRQGSASKHLVHVPSKQLVDACDVRQEKPSRDTSQGKATRKHRSLTITPCSGPLTLTPRSVCQARVLQEKAMHRRVEHRGKLVTLPGDTRLGQRCRKEQREPARWNWQGCTLAKLRHARLALDTSFLHLQHRRIG
jgi:hypothetical protein